MNTRTIECTPAELVSICAEADQSPAFFGTAAALGLCFRGGFDHAAPAKNGWSVKLHDRGMNDRGTDFLFLVPVKDRATNRGPAK